MGKFQVGDIVRGIYSRREGRITSIEPSDRVNVTPTDGLGAAWSSGPMPQDRFELVVRPIAVIKAVAPFKIGDMVRHKGTTNWPHEVLGVDDKVYLWLKKRDGSRISGLAGAYERVEQQVTWVRVD